MILMISYGLLNAIERVVTFKLIVLKGSNFENLSLEILSDEGHQMIS